MGAKSGQVFMADFGMTVPDRAGWYKPLFSIRQPPDERVPPGHVPLRDDATDAEYAISARRELRRHVNTKWPVMRVVYATTARAEAERAGYRPRLSGRGWQSERARVLRHQPLAFRFMAASSRKTVVRLPHAAAPSRKRGLTL
jgi:hypothetical protein